MIRHYLQRDNDAIQRFRTGRQQPAQIIFYGPGENLPPAPGAPDEVVVNQRNGSISASVLLTHRHSIP